MLSLDSRVFTLPGSLHSATVEMSGVGRPHKCLVLAALTSGGHPHKWWPPSQMCGGGCPRKCLVVAALTNVWWWLPSQMSGGGCPHKWWPPSQMVTALTSGVRPHNLHPCRVQPFSLHTSRTHTLVVCDPFCCILHTHPYILGPHTHIKWHRQRHHDITMGS